MTRVRHLGARPQLDAVESALDACVPADAPAGLGEAMRYAVLDGGKRLRPLLVLAAAEAVHGARRRRCARPCAVELIHAYSLVHDDLPCMDDDVLRRGKPTVHVALRRSPGDARRRRHAGARVRDADARRRQRRAGAAGAPVRPARARARAAPAWRAARRSTSASVGRPLDEQRAVATCTAARRARCCAPAC